MDIRILENIALFEALSEAELEALANRFQIRRLPKNMMVLNEGDDSVSLYIILEGSVDVFITADDGHQFKLDTLGTGEYFGEVAPLDNGPRSASVITTCESNFAVLTKQEFLNCVTQNPDFALKVVQGLSQRLRRLSEKIRILSQAPPPA